MKRAAQSFVLLLCMIPIAANAFPIEAAMNGSARSYEWQTNNDTIIYEIDIGQREQVNEAVISVETVTAMKSQEISLIEYKLPWISALLDLDALVIPQDNEQLRLTVSGVEPLGDMRVRWRAYRPAKLVDPFELGLAATFTHITLAPGIAGVPRPDPDPISGAALGFRTEIRYSYARERIRVLRWSGSDFVDIPSANWDLFEEDGKTYVEGFLLEPGIYAVIDAKGL